MKWSEVDPHRHPYDPDLVYLAADKVMTRWLGEPAPRSGMYADLKIAFITEYGAWAGEWWNQTGVLVTAEDAVAGLSRWREHLELLARTFAELRLANAGFGLAVEIERAAARLLAIVAEYTYGEDAWYATMTEVLTGYLEAGGITDEKLHGRVETVIEGHFHSWTVPDEQTAQIAFRKVAALVEGQAPQRDALQDGGSCAHICRRCWIVPGRRRSKTRIARTSRRSIAGKILRARCA